jgi:hypothetical protein
MSQENVDDKAVREESTGETSRRQSRRKGGGGSGFGSIKQVGVGVSIGFPLLVIGVLMLGLFIVSLVGTATLLWIIAGLVVTAGLIAAVSGRVL